LVATTVAIVKVIVPCMATDPSTSKPLSLHITLVATSVVMVKATDTFVLKEDGDGR